MHLNQSSGAFRRAKWMVIKREYEWVNEPQIKDSSNFVDSGPWHKGESGIISKLAMNPSLTDCNGNIVGEVEIVIN